MSEIESSSTAPSWDISLRLFHWLLVVLIALQYLSGEYEWFSLQWHFCFGYATLALLLFRTAWGFFGPINARFSAFLVGPKTVAGHIHSLFTGKLQNYPGHNPLGGWSTLLMLTSIALQIATGMFSENDLGEAAPLASRVSEHTVRLMTRLHHLNQKLLLGLIILHLAAVLFYWAALRRNLIKPMIFSSTTSDSMWPRALLILSISIVLVAMLIVWGGG